MTGSMSTRAHDSPVRGRRSSRLAATHRRPVPVERGAERLGRAQRLDVGIGAARGHAAGVEQQAEHRGVVLEEAILRVRLTEGCNVARTLGLVTTELAAVGPE